MHGHAFLIDVDVSGSGQVNTPSTLNIGINDGMQVNNTATIGANRLLVFTGTALNFGIIGHDDNLAHGVFRVRLRFPLGQSVIFKGAATIAALAGLHGEGDEDLTFAADAAITVTDPTDGGTLRQTSPPLPDNELYVIIDAAYQGDGSRLTRLCYQANVLVQDLEPDIDSLLVRPAGEGDFGPSATFTLTGGDAFYDLQVNLTGPVPPDKSPFQVGLQSSDNNNVPLSVTLLIDSPDSSGILPQRKIVGTTPPEIVTLTGFGRHATRTATLIINRLK